MFYRKNVHSDTKPISEDKLTHPMKGSHRMYIQKNRAAGSTAALYRDGDGMYVSSLLPVLST